MQTKTPFVMLLVAFAIHFDAFGTVGLAPRQTKKLWGKLYIIPNDIDELLRRYNRDFETKS